MTELDQQLYIHRVEKSDTALHILIRLCEYRVIPLETFVGPYYSWADGYALAVLVGARFVDVDKDAIRVRDEALDYIERLKALR